MPSLKAIRKRIASVKSTQKITRAMKMVAGARLARAQQRILALRPYAKKTQEVLAAVVVRHDEPSGSGGEDSRIEPDHPFLVERPERRVALVLLTSDRGLCGAFNANLCRASEREWKRREADGEAVVFYTIGRKGRDYVRRRGAQIADDFAHVWDKLGIDQAQRVARTVIPPLVDGQLDAIYLVYNEFKSAMSQRVVVEPLLPVRRSPGVEEVAEGARARAARSLFLFEPTKTALFERLVPMYVEISLLRALYESMASELGARMTAMDAATKNAKEMIDRLTLAYNRARQAAITKELMEIIGGAEALKG